RDFAMLDYYEYEKHIGVANFIRMTALKTIHLANLYFPPAMLIASVMGAIRSRVRSTRLALLLVIALPIVHMIMIPITRPPYFAPIVGAIILLVIAGVRSAPRRFVPLVTAILLASQFAA